MKKIFPNGFKNSGLNTLLKGGARIVDNVALNGAVFNVIDQNGKPPGSFDGSKFFRKAIIWVPFILMALQLAGFLSSEDREALEGTIPNQ